MLNSDLPSNNFSNKSDGFSLKVKVSRLILAWELPFSSLLLALLFYSIFARIRGPITSTSIFPYYNYLADAFLHGQLHLRLLPPTTHDLVYFNQRYYLYWPPLPAILFMPLVLIFGVNFSDILVTVVLGSVNVGLVALLLRQACAKGIIRISRMQRAWMVLFFALGTVHITLAPHGRVWFTAQVIAFGFTILAFLIPIAMKGWIAFFLSGVAVASAMLTRNHLIFIGIWPAFYLLYTHRKFGIPRLYKYSLVGISIPILALIGFLAYNWVRFGDIFDVGLYHHQMDHFFQDDFSKYGAFDVAYIPKNLFYQYINYPFPFRMDSVMGGSLFLLSPVFFAAFQGIIKGRPRISMAFLVLTILAVSIPILLLMGTGWVQFGPRYTLDFTVPLLLLTAKGIRRWRNSILAILTMISIIQYIGGYLYLIKLGVI